MAVTFAKKHPSGAQLQVAKPKIKLGTDVQHITDTQMLVDELVMIETFLSDSDVVAHLDRRDELKKRLQSIAADMPLDEEVVLVGTEGEVRLSKARVTTEIADREAMIAKLGHDVFLQIAKVGLTELKKYLVQSEIDKFTTQTYGARSYSGVTVTAK